MQSTEPRAPKALIFDMDGLMLDTEVLYRRVWQIASAELGYPLSDEFYAKLVGRPLPVCFELLMEECGPDYPLATFRARSREVWDLEVKSSGILHKTGLKELLEWLKTQPLLKGVATSTFRKEAIPHLGALADHFDAITTGDEVTHGKPAPDIFLLAAKKLGIAPEDCWVLEDSESGARGALAAGMTVVVVPDLVQPSAELAAKAYRVCRSLHDVVPLLAPA